MKRHSSAFVVFILHQHDLGMGIVLGSNFFNLAALLGLGAALAGQVSAQLAGTIANGAVALGATILIAPWLNPNHAGGRFRHQS